MQIINLEATLSTPHLEAELSTPSLQVEMRTLRLGSGGTDDYPDLNNKPSINGTTLVGNILTANLGIKTSELTNDSGYITTADIPTKTSDLINDSDFQTGNQVTAAITAAIPTNVSYFTNDSGYITAAAIPTEVSAFNNDIGYLTLNDLPSFAVNSVNGQTGDVTIDGSNLDYDANTSINDKIDSVESAIPTKTSELTNNSGFITAADIPVQSVNGQTGIIDLLEMGTVENAGSSVTVNDAGAAGIPYLTLDITPRQNLNGYDKPWAGGTGENLCNMSDVVPATSLMAYGLTVTKDESTGEITVSGTPSWTTNGGKLFRAFKVPGIYSNGYGCAMFNISHSANLYNVGYHNTGADDYIVIKATNTDLGDVNISFKPVVYSGGTTPSEWTPYDNICPIYDWAQPEIQINSDFPFSTTIYNFYGGTYDCIARTGMNTYTHIASYAGETINEPWMSSLDEYIPGTTPTTGAEVVYLDEDNATSVSGNMSFNEAFVDGTNTVTLITTRANFTIKKLRYFKNTTNEFLQKLVMLAKTNTF